MYAKIDFAIKILLPLTGNFKSEELSELKNNVFVKIPTPMKSWITWTMSTKIVKNSSFKFDLMQMLIMLLNISIIKNATIPMPIKIASVSKILT